MAFKASSCSTHGKAFPTWLWLAFAIATPILLGLGTTGILKLFGWVAARDAVEQAELTRNLFLAVLPILLFAFVSAAIAIHYVRHAGTAKATDIVNGLKNQQNYYQDFTRLIADNRPGSTLIVDGAWRLWFANQQALHDFNVQSASVMGQAFDKIVPEADRLRLTHLIQECRRHTKATETINPVRRGAELRYIKSQIIPLPNSATMQDAVMINEDDVTSILVEREARERMFRQVIDTLVAVVDRRDPFATGHSVRVGQVAKAIATQLTLDQIQIETAEIAGLLMNFGKVLVPREILVKKTALTPEELRQVHDSMLSSADILALIGFSQPVVPTLRQMLEHYDGSGAPQGLRGEDILLTARIIAVANSFVALLSARAHRANLSVSDALAMMSGRADTLYDRRVIEALTTVIAAHGHTLDWLPTAPA